MDIKIIKTDWSEHRAPLKKVRTLVFVEEQNVPAEMEWEEEDNSAIHFLAFNSEDQAIATARLLASGKIGRMAVLKPYRNNQIGTKLLQTCIKTAREMALESVYLHAQSNAVGFYQKFHFTIVGDKFYEAGIPHFKMALELENQNIHSTHPSSEAKGQVRHLPLGSELQSQLTHMVAQGTRSLQLLCWDLEPQLLDNEQSYDAFSKFARQNRLSKIQVLLQDNRQIIRHGHRLLDLCRRLPSHMEIRKISEEFSEVEEFILTVDQRNIIFRENNAQRNFVCAPNALALAKEKSNFFNDLWKHSSSDPNLRKLNL